MTLSWPIGDKESIDVVLAETSIRFKLVLNAVDTVGELFNVTAKSQLIEFTDDNKIYVPLTRSSFLRYTAEQTSDRGPSTARAGSIASVGLSVTLDLLPSAFIACSRNL